MILRKGTKVYIKKEYRDSIAYGEGVKKEEIEACGFQGKIVDYIREYDIYDVLFLGKYGAYLDDFNLSVIEEQEELQ